MESTSFYRVGTNASLSRRLSALERHLGTGDQMVLRMELREELRGPRIASAGAETIRPAVSCQLGAAGAIVTRMTGKPDRSQQVTIDAMLAASKRDTRRVPIRNTFVQQGSQSDPEPGPLHEMVRRHDERCLDLFLLHRMMASADPWDVRPMPAKAWARALGVHHDRDGGKAAVSKAWRRLDQTYHLIEVGRSGQRGKYTSLSEDGSALIHRPHMRLRSHRGEGREGGCRRDGIAGLPGFFTGVLGRGRWGRWSVSGRWWAGRGGEQGLPGRGPGPVGGQVQGQSSCGGGDAGGDVDQVGADGGPAGTGMSG